MYETFKVRDILGVHAVIFLLGDEVRTRRWIMEAQLLLLTSLIFSEVWKRNIALTLWSWDAHLPAIGTSAQPCQSKWTSARFWVSPVDGSKCSQRDKPGMKILGGIYRQVSEVYHACVRDYYYTSWINIKIKINWQSDWNHKIKVHIRKMSKSFCYDLPVSWRYHARS